MYHRPLTSGETAMFYILMVAVILSNMAEYVVLQLLVSCVNQWRFSHILFLVRLDEALTFSSKHPKIFDESTDMITVRFDHLGLGFNVSNLFDLILKLKTTYTT